MGHPNFCWCEGKTSADSLRELQQEERVLNPLRIALRDVFDVDFAPVFAEVFGDQAAVAVVVFFFAAQQSGAVEELR